MNLDLPTYMQTDWFKALTVLAGAVLIALVFQFFLIKVFRRWASKTQTDLDDRLLQAVQVPIFISVLAGGAWQALNFFEIRANILELIYGFLATVVILLWMFAALGFGNFLVNWLSGIEDRFMAVQPRTQPIFQMLVKVFVILTGLYFILIAWDQNVLGWFASASVAGVVLGFAAKDTLANFFSGIFIIADAPYKLGDYIVLKNGERGRVTDIGIRSTRLMTRDDVEIIIPNALIGNAEIFNQSGGSDEKFRLRVKVSVAYGSDIDRVRALLMDIATSEPMIIKDPKPRVRFREFGDSGLNFELLAWVRLPEDRGRAVDILLTRIYKSFGEHDIEIPYPKRDVYLYHKGGETTKSPPGKDESGS